MRLLFAFLTLTLAALTAAGQPPAPAPPDAKAAPLKTFTLAKHGNVKVKLGAKLTPPDKRKPTVRLAQFLASPVNLPAEVDYWSNPAAITVMTEMYANNSLGDCVIAGKGHGIGLASAADGGPGIVFTDGDIKRTYFQFSPNDQGCNIPEVLDYFRDTGWDWGGKHYQIDGYVQVNFSNRDQVKAAIYLFGPNTIGFSVPADWINGAGPNVVWTPTNSPIEGGHDVTLCGYDAEGVYLSTWGIAGSADKSRRPVKMRWDAFTSNAWLSEMYAVLYPEWYGSNKLSPTGLDVPGLRKALDQIKNGQIPDGPVQPPPPPPGPVDPPPPPPGPVNPPVGPLVLDITVAGHIPLLGNVTLTGTATQRAAQPTTGPAARLSIADWLKVIQFIEQLVALWQNHSNFGPVDAQAGANWGINWTDLEKWLPIIIKEVGVLAPVILADLTAGKTWGQIVADVIAALVTAGHQPVAPNHFRAAADGYYTDVDYQRLAAEARAGRYSSPFSVGADRPGYVPFFPHGWKGIPDGRWQMFMKGTEVWVRRAPEEHPAPQAPFGSGFANPIAPAPTTYPQAMPSAGFHPLRGFFANQFGAGHGGVVPPGMHAHRRADGSVIVHGDENYGDPAAHAGVVGAGWPKIAVAGQPVPGGGFGATAGVGIGGFTATAGFARPTVGAGGGCPGGVCPAPSSGPLAPIWGLIRGR